MQLNKKQTARLKALKKFVITKGTWKGTKLSMLHFNTLSNLEAKNQLVEPEMKEYLDLLKLEQSESL